MVDVTAIQAPTFSDNDETEKVDGDVGAERNETAAEDAVHDIVVLVSACEISKNITITQLFWIVDLSKSTFLKKMPDLRFFFNFRKRPLWFYLLYLHNIGCVKESHAG